jgi:hypothetical protein
MEAFPIITDCDRPLVVVIIFGQLQDLLIVYGSGGFPPATEMKRLFWGGGNINADWLEQFLKTGGGEYSKRALRFIGL